MQAPASELMVDINQLRLGMFVVLDLGWMGHPFPRSRFKITTTAQLEQLRDLRLTSVKVLREQSDPQAFDAPADASLLTPDAEVPVVAAEPVAQVLPASPQAKEAQAALKRRTLAQQNASLARCEKQFGTASAAWKQIASLSQREPLVALQRTTEVVNGFMGELSGAHDVSIRLLSEAAGDAGAMQCDEATLQDIGVGALLHDIGKQALPDRIRWKSDHFTAVEERMYRDHVNQGVQMATRMGLTVGALRVISQHHETADAKGYPQAVTGDALSDAAKIVSLVNAYDSLCNPGALAAAATPYEALSLMFAQLKPKFDPDCLTAFIRLMGVYPPGSIVQLRDDRYALVVSVNAARPLKPTVIVFDSKVPRDEAMLLDLQTDAKLGIRRSLHPRNLAPDAMAYLAPRKRNSYFFEQNHEAVDASAAVWVEGNGNSATAVSVHVMAPGAAAHTKG